MTDKQLMRMLKSAYELEESDTEREFVRTHEMRRMQLFDIVALEFRYMGWKSILSGVILCIILIIVSARSELSSVWCMSSFLPLLALLMSAALGRSERFRMCELEASCRFSLRFVRMVRMLIVGAASLLLVIICTVSVQRQAGGGFIAALCHVSCPYLLNVFACLFVTRKWHAGEDIFICAGTTCFSCLLPYIVNIFGLVGNLGDSVSSVILPVLFLMTVRESVLYIKEGDRIIWNFC